MKYYVAMVGNRPTVYGVPNGATKITDEQKEYLCANPSISSIDEVLAMEIASKPKPTLEDKKREAKIKATEKLADAKGKAFEELLAERTADEQAAYEKRIEEIEKAENELELQDER